MEHLLFYYCSGSVFINVLNEKYHQYSKLNCELIGGF